MEVSKFDGEVFINNCKGKFIFFYEWSVKLNWIGIFKLGVQYKGYVEIFNLFDENSVDEVEISVSFVKDEFDINFVVLMKEEGVKFFREVMGIYISIFKIEFIQGMILFIVNGELVDLVGQLVLKIEECKVKFVFLKIQVRFVGVKIFICKIIFKEIFLMLLEEFYRVFII